MEYSVALLIFGILLLLVGLIGKVKAKELEVGTGNPVTRVVVGMLGVGLVLLSLLISPAVDLLPRLDLPTTEPGTGTEPVEPGPGDEPAPFEEPAPGPFLDARVAVVSVGERLGEVTAEALAPSVADLEVIPHDALQELGVFSPDLIVVAADTGGVWSEMSDRVLRTLFRGKRIVGLGSGGTDLFQELGATIGTGSGAHFPGRHDVVLANFPSGHVAPPDLPPEFPVHHPGPSDVHGIYDGGSPALRGFEAFAHPPGSDHHWSVLRQGNLLLWGFDAPLKSLTDEGRALLIALMQDHLQRPFISFEERLPKVEVFPPGRYAERLTAQFSDQEWHIRLEQPGPIRAMVEFDSELGPLALILNGPGQVGFFERNDGGSPLEIIFEVTPELLERGDVWRVSVTKFGEVPRPIEYTIELDFPG